MTPRPRRQVCPLCGLDDPDVVTWEPEGPGLWRYVCANPRHVDPYTWLTTGKDPLARNGDDHLSEELGLYGDLLRCLHSESRFVEYGVVEYRYATANNSTYRYLVNMFNHTSLQDHLQYSASAFIGAALGRMYRDGRLVRVLGPATGYWKYNDSLHAWALPALAATGPVLSWKEFAVSKGLDPMSWPVAELGIG